MNISFQKYADYLVPAIVQDSFTGKVLMLMLGFMNETSYDQTVKTGSVTFFSQSRQLLWIKGETSGNFLQVAHSD